MNLQITGRHLEITPAIHEYVINKLGRLDKFFDYVVEGQVVLSVERHIHTAEITLRLPGKDLHCSDSEESLYAAIDLLVDKLERQIVKYKSKGLSREHHRDHHFTDETSTE